MTDRVGRVWPRSPAAERPPPLFWIVGVAAVALAATAFVLWVWNGAGILLDLMSALCL